MCTSPDIKVDRPSNFPACQACRPINSLTGDILSQENIDPARVTAIEYSCTPTTETTQHAVLHGTPWVADGEGSTPLPPLAMTKVVPCRGLIFQQEQSGR